jgi:hypothetical protein
METLDDIFGAWDTITAMASDLDKPRARVEKWQERSRIPSDYWPGLIDALRRKGHELTSDDLLAMHERSRRSA